MPWRAFSVGRVRSAGRLRPTVAEIPQRRITANPVLVLRACVRGSHSINVGSQPVSHGAQHFPVGPETALVGWRSTGLGPLCIPFRRRVPPVPRIPATARLITRSLGSELVAVRRLGRQAPSESALAFWCTGRPLEFARAGLRTRTTVPVTVPLLAAPTGWPPRIPAARSVITVTVTRPPRIPAARRAIAIAIANRMLQVTSRIRTTGQAIAS
jgi:hypothetical protein